MTAPDCNYPLCHDVFITSSKSSIDMNGIDPSASSGFEFLS